MVLVQFAPEVLADLQLLSKLPVHGQLIEVHSSSLILLQYSIVLSVLKELLKIALESIANGETKRNYNKVAGT